MDSALGDTGSAFVSCRVRCSVLTRCDNVVVARLASITATAWYMDYSTVWLHLVNVLFLPIFLRCSPLASPHESGLAPISSSGNKVYLLEFLCCWCRWCENPRWRAEHRLQQAATGTFPARCKRSWAASSSFSYAFFIYHYRKCGVNIAIGRPGAVYVSRDPFSL